VSRPPTSKLVVRNSKFDIAPGGHVEQGGGVGGSREELTVEGRRAGWNGGLDGEVGMKEEDGVDGPREREWE
jgi:hypothetical protein